MSTPSPTPKPPRERRTVPAWAFYTVVVVAIVFGIVAGVIWFYLQSCRNYVLTPSNSKCPTVLPQTCCKLDPTSGLPLAACKTSCVTNADCTITGQPTCTSGVCGP